MQARKFTVQPYAGGEEVTFYEVPPCELRATVAFKGDSDYEQLSDIERNYLVGIAFCILSGRRRGYADVLGMPSKLTAASCIEWAGDYAVGIEASDIPTGEVEKNPTGAKE